MWADSTVESLLGRFKEINMGMIAELKACPSQDRMRLVTDHMATRSIVAYFHSTQVSTTAQATMVERNRLNPSKQFTDAHLRGGIYGARIPPAIDLDMPASQEDVLTVIAMGAYLHQSPPPKP